MKTLCLCSLLSGAKTIKEYVNMSFILGNNCQTNIDECETDPCLNGATCIDGIAMYTCECREGFNGAQCENYIDECEMYQPCQNGAKCIGNLHYYV